MVESANRAKSLGLWEEAIDLFIASAGREAAAAATNPASGAMASRHYR